MPRCSSVNLRPPPLPAYFPPSVCNYGTWTYSLVDTHLFTILPDLQVFVWTNGMDGMGSPFPPLGISSVTPSRVYG